MTLIKTLAQTSCVFFDADIYYEIHYAHYETIYSYNSIYMIWTIWLAYS